MAALEVLNFLDNVRALRDRRDMVMSSAVSSGIITPIQAWPEFFGDDEGDPGAFPGTGTDTTAFRLEDATPESFEADMEALIAASERVAIREQPAPEPPRFAAGLPHTEWT